MIGDAARLKSAFALIDTAPLKDLEGRLKPLMEEGRPYRVQAREALAFARLKAGDTAGARGDFVVLSQLLDASQGAQARAQAAIGLIDSGSAKAVPGVVKQPRRRCRRRRCSIPAVCLAGRRLPISRRCRTSRNDEPQDDSRRPDGGGAGRERLLDGRASSIPSTRRTTGPAELAGEGQRISIIPPDQLLEPAAALKGVDFFLPPAGDDRGLAAARRHARNSASGNVDAAPDLSVAWRKSIGQGAKRGRYVTAPPIAADGKVFVMDGDGRGRRPIDARTGAQVWRTGDQSAGDNKRDKLRLRRRRRRRRRQALRLLGLSLQ